MTRPFDPVRVGRSECLAWASYYRRSWPGVLVGAFGMVWHGFGLDPLRTGLAAAYVLRANQVWAPYPDNNPAAARTWMSRFYRLVDRAGRLAVDAEVAADLEVTWWHAHRERQHDGGGARDPLTTALTELYAYVYHAPPDRVRAAAVLRVEAMDLSDAWVAGGCRAQDPLLDAERRALVSSYLALPPAVVHRSS